MYHFSVLAIVLLALVPPGTASADSHRESAHAVQCTVARDRELGAIVQRKLENYSRLLPRIQFVILSDRMARGLGMLELLHLLGQDAANLDYEHPPALRADLLEVSIARVGLHLRNNSTSSALFKVGGGAAAEREQLCVLTLDACAIARDNRQATRHLLGLPEQVLARMPVEKYLDADQHLEYVVDHEVRHCLTAHRGSPIPMSTREYWAGYNQLLNESSADAYALAMHIQKYGTSSRYAETLTHIRGIALLLGDPDHHTAVAMRAVPEVLSAATGHAAGMERAFVVAQTIRRAVDPGYDEYLKYRYAAFELMSRIGIKDVEGVGAIGELPDYLPDSARVDGLCREMSAHYRALFGNPLNVELE